MLNSSKLPLYKAYDDEIRENAKDEERLEPREHKLNKILKVWSRGAINMSISGERGGDDPERKGGSPKFPYSHGAVAGFMSNRHETVINFGEELSHRGS